MAFIVGCDGFAKFGYAQRRRIAQRLLLHCAERRLQHRPGRGKVRLPDLHVHDAASGTLELARTCQHFHHMERGDLLHATREAQGIHGQGTGVMGRSMGRSRPGHDAPPMRVSRWIFLLRTILIVTSPGF